MALMYLPDTEARKSPPGRAGMATVRVIATNAERTKRIRNGVRRVLAPMCAGKKPANDLQSYSRQWQTVPKIVPSGGLDGLI